MEAWREMQDCAPDIRVLWDKTPCARKPHICDCCGDPINPGDKYESVGLVEDGVFRAEKRHLYAYGDVSGCPRFRERDLADRRAEFEHDQAQYFPGDSK